MRKETIHRDIKPRNRVKRNWGTINKWRPWVLVAGPSKLGSKVLTSCGEWRRFRTEAEAMEAALDHDTAFACYSGWEPTEVVHESEILV